MSRAFTKLFASITESTMWSEPHATRVVWITMLAMCDSRGRVWASIPGLAHRARVTTEEAAAALARFLAPDRYSRTPDYEGRRIEAIDGGWRLLNYEKYRELRDEEERREYQARWVADKRKSKNVDRCRQSRPQSTKEEVEVEVEEDKDKNHARERAVSSSPPGFEDFWKAWPNTSRKQSKGECLAKWRKGNFEAQTEAILVHVEGMKRTNEWMKENRAFVPAPVVYLKQRRWEGAPADLGKKQPPQLVI